uniref:Uncharacterized protein n=1 Tax=Amphimedon queenslandica TaxID=400682 RepID=A0A1X7VE68_AMPQE
MTKEDFEEQKEVFCLQEVNDVVLMEDIPSQLIMYWVRMAKKHSQMMKHDLTSTKKEQQEGINCKADMRSPMNVTDVGMLNYLSPVASALLSVIPVGQAPVCFKETCAEDLRLEKHLSLLQEKFGKLKGMEATVFVPLDGHFQVFKPRPIPYALKQKVKLELDLAQKVGIITPVEYSDWAAPTVPVFKPDGGVCCGDHKVTVNSV